MAIREIPRNEWTTYCDGFTREYRGWIATIEGSEEATRLQPVAEDLPFVGITYDLEEDVVSLAIGTEPERHWDHTVDMPERIWVRENQEGVSEAIGVDSRDGERVAVRFRTPLSPEQLNGIAGHERA